MLSEVKRIAKKGITKYWNIGQEIQEWSKREQSEREREENGKKQR